MMDNLKLKHNLGYSEDDIVNGINFSKFLLNLKELNIIGLDNAIEICNKLNGKELINKTFTFIETEKALSFSNYLINLDKSGISDLETSINLFKTINGYELDINTESKGSELIENIRIENNNHSLKMKKLEENMENYLESIKKRINDLHNQIDVLNATYSESVDGNLISKINDKIRLLEELKSEIELIANTNTDNNTIPKTKEKYNFSINNYNGVSKFIDNQFELIREKINSVDNEKEITLNITINSNDLNNVETFAKQLTEQIKRKGLNNN